MIKDTFIETIKEYAMLEPEDLVLVAVSGGADSTALLHLLDACKDQLGISLHIAHLNHNIRKGESDLDVRYVQGLAQKLKVPLQLNYLMSLLMPKKKKGDWKKPRAKCATAFSKGWQSRSARTRLR